MTQTRLFTPFELFGIEVNEGWWPLIKPIYNRIQELNKSGANIEINQIKEKWGELCIYVSSAPEEIYNMIRDAEQRSIHICEDCGKPAESVISTHSWIYTLCPECLKKRGIKVDTTVKEFNRRMKEADSQIDNQYIKK